MRRSESLKRRSEDEEEEGSRISNLSRSFKKDKFFEKVIDMNGR